VLGRLGPGAANGQKAAHDRVIGKSPIIGAERRPCLQNPTWNGRGFARVPRVTHDKSE